MCQECRAGDRTQMQTDSGGRGSQMQRVYFPNSTRKGKHRILGTRLGARLGTLVTYDDDLTRTETHWGIYIDKD